MANKRLSTHFSTNNTFKLGRGASSAAIPNAPTIGTATTVNDISATVTYTAAVLGANASSFTATSNPGSLTGTGASPITVSGLTASTNYTFTVTATNANGTSPTSAASNQITTDAPITIADLIIIAGGGAGGPGGGSGGGGAGGLVYLESQSITGTNTVTIGAGGPKTAGTVVNGVNSSFGSLTAAIGGGGGGRDVPGGDDNGNSGGSGGGGSIDSSGRASGTFGQGNQGGLGKRGSNNILSGGGGGGAGAAGVDAGSSIDTPGAGGDGLSTYSSWGAATSSGQNISGTYWYAGGGAGYGWNIVGTAAAGRGGGGNYASVNGATNTGGGGFAGSTGNGGSGIVIIKYPTSKTITIGAGLTGTTYTSGGYKYTKITAGTGNVSFA